MADKKHEIEPTRDSVDGVVAGVVSKVTKSLPAEILSGVNFEVVQYSI